MKNFDLFSQPVILSLIGLFLFGSALMHSLNKETTTIKTEITQVEQTEERVLLKNYKILEEDPLDYLGISLYLVTSSVDSEDDEKHSEYKAALGISNINWNEPVDIIYYNVDVEIFGKSKSSNPLNAYVIKPKKPY